MKITNEAVFMMISTLRIGTEIEGNGGEVVFVLDDSFGVRGLDDGEETLVNAREILEKYPYLTTLDQVV